MDVDARLHARGLLALLVVKGLVTAEEIAALDEVLSEHWFDPTVSTMKLADALRSRLAGNPSVVMLKP